jgi:hypothetical protein
MKKVIDIDKEIAEQIKKIKKKGAKPELLLLGDLSYYTLKVENPDKLEVFQNSGPQLTEYKGLRVIKRPVHESGGIFKAEHEAVEVFGR